MKKVNKKAILAMLVAMVMSLGMMGGINGESQDSNLQQYATASFIIASKSESTLGKTVGTAVGSAFSGASTSCFFTAFIIGGPAALILGITWGTVTAA
ncbi:MAG: hypothetical protein LBG80_07985 [Bacteroidales bacterium]|jgi:hypothetical protein|nr:hypothetical protein [Bacteroidales bacterium]